MTVDLTLRNNMLPGVLIYGAGRMGRIAHFVSGSVAVAASAVLGYTHDWGTASNRDGTGPWSISARGAVRAHILNLNPKSGAGNAWLTSDAGIWPSAIAYVELDVAVTNTAISPASMNVILRDAVAADIIRNTIVDSSYSAALPIFTGNPVTDEMDASQQTVSCSFASATGLRDIRITAYHNGDGTDNQFHLNAVRMWYYVDP